MFPLIVFDANYNDHMFQVETTWELEHQFVVEGLHYVMQRDSLDDTLPLDNKEVYSPDDISKMFGTISYDKGASIIRMIEHTMGHDKFMQGLKTYFHNK